MLVILDLEGRSLLRSTPILGRVVNSVIVPLALRRKLGLRASISMLLHPRYNK